MAHPLTTYRSARGLSMEAFAASIGASKSMISKWESGVATPRRRYQQVVFEATGGEVSPAAWVLPLEAEHRGPAR